VSKNMVMLVAHPDDEVIFGWPVLKEAKRIICCSSDLHNPERAWCKDRLAALKEVGSLVDAEVFCLDYNSEFYRLSTRDGKLNEFVEEVLDLLRCLIPKYEDDIIFTHNSWGEYGNIDHILVNQIARLTDRKIITTDIAIDAGWFKVENLFLKEEISKHTIDLNFYEKCKKIYDKYGCWTWSKDPITQAKLYEDNHSAV